MYVWRNLEFTGIPEEMTVYEDGEVRRGAPALADGWPGSHARGGELCARQSFSGGRSSRFDELTHLEPRGCGLRPTR